MTGVTGVTGPTGVTGVTGLRGRLTLLGVIGVLTPLLVLLAVAAWTSEEVRVASDGSTTTTTGGLSPWIPLTVGLLLVPAAVAAWWWAGRAVALQERAAAALERERRLVEDAGHQLRTPITVLVTNADVALADPEPSVRELREAVRQSRDTAVAMQDAIDGLLADARARRLDGAGGGADLGAVIARVSRSYEPAARARGIRIRRTGAGRSLVAVDAQAVERAVDALVDNAVRHSPDGAEVRIDVSASDGIAAVAVTDDGPGIPAEQHADVFRRYWTTDPARSGIGLAVVAEAARGAFEVEVVSPTARDGGTTLVLRLPVHRQSPAGALPGAERPGTPA